MMSYLGLDFVYYGLGVNIIPADTINKKPLINGNIIRLTN